MITKSLRTFLAASVAASSLAAPAASDELGAALLGAVIGGVVVNEVHKNKQRKAASAPAPSTAAVPQGGSVAYSAARQQTRETQTALNYFDFPAGSADGISGRRTRAAISQYQSYMGYAATGQLTQYERDFLTTSYARAQLGGAQVAQATQSAAGSRSLLRSWQQEAAGGTMAAAPSAPVNTASSALPLAGVQLFDAPGETSSAPSLASYCSRVSLVTSTSGGYTTLANLSDPGQALGEQFCLARSYAINDGEKRMGTVQGVSQSQADDQCDAFGPALEPYRARLPLEGSGPVLADTQNLVLQSGMSLDKLRNTAAVCLFSGYRRDRMDVALSAALILAGAGRRPYAELVGHHLLQGLGTTQSVPHGQDWYTVAVSALEAGAEPAFAPGQPERTALIKAASAALGGGALVQPVPASGAAATLPLIGGN